MILSDKRLLFPQQRNEKKREEDKNHQRKNKSSK